MSYYLAEIDIIYGISFANTQYIHLDQQVKFI